MTTLTRRDFIKLGGAALAGVAFPPPPFRNRAAPGSAHLGRVAELSAWVRTEPDIHAPTVRHHRRDDVITYFEQVETSGPNPHNPIWLRVIGGYIYSTQVQPVELCFNTPLQHIPTGGLWGEVSIPYTAARRTPDPHTYRSYRLPYSSVYRVVEAVWGTDHHLWYRLHDSQAPTARLYAPAAHIRPIPPSDLEPISPHVHDKRILVSLTDQLLVALENGRPVFETLISSGTGGDRATPRGHHHIIFKAPSRHMVGDTYNLPGVPFDSYFWGAVAIHGAYWHNDFGRPRSHGCVNVPSAAARWIFRWTQPTTPYDEDGLRVQEGGTSVIVS